VERVPLNETLTSVNRGRSDAFTMGYQWEVDVAIVTGLRHADAALTLPALPRSTISQMIRALFDAITYSVGLVHTFF